MAVAIALDNVTAGYGAAPVLRNFSLRIERGERVAIMGRSGAGKSTLLNLIYRTYADDVALIPQASALVANLSVFHNVFMGRLDQHSTLYNLRTLIWPPAREVEAAGRVLSAVGLSDKFFAKAGELSGGQQQRTSVARALYNGRVIVAGDEPVSALDRVQAGEILRLLSERHETKIFALHDVRLALEHTDRIVLIEHGRIALDEPAKRLSYERLLPYFEGELV
jgi:phosphonate transport system ATP-binding protein